MMTKSEQKHFLPRYVGELSAEEIAQGMNAALQNARRLAADARILLEASRYPTAASVAALSIEEAGKTTILRQLATACGNEEVKRVWREYRSHKAKNTMWILPDLAAKGADSLMQLGDAADKDGEHTAVLDAVKQIGFYTDCYGDRHWCLPSEVISRDLAKQLVMTAEVLSQRPEISPREIELWTEIMKPVWETPAMREALIRWHEAMIREGLTSRAQEQFERFVLGPEAGPASDKEPDSK